MCSYKENESDGSNGGGEDNENKLEIHEEEGINEDDDREKIERVRIWCLLIIVPSWL